MLAQSSEIIGCSPLNDLIADMPTGFKKARGKFKSIVNNDSVFASRIQLPGALVGMIQKRNTYIGIAYEGNSFTDFQTAYDRMLDMMYKCLSPDDFEVTNIGKLGDARMHEFPDKQFRTKEHNENDGHEHSASPTGASGKIVVVYVNAAYISATGNYKLQVLIHP